MISREKARLLRQMIVKAAASLADADALTAVELFAPWAVGVEYAEDTADRRVRIRYGGKLYRVRQAHTSQADWTPDIATSLYEEIKEQGQGTKDNPIPYNGSMALENGLYYTQYDVEYLCIRDTINPVYNPLSELVGLYVEVVEE